MCIDKKEFVKAKVHTQVTPAEMLKTLRELQEMTQKELANKTGLSQSNISAMENGTSQIGRERALKLALALKTHPAVIFFPDFDSSTIAPYQYEVLAFLPPKSSLKL